MASGATWNKVKLIDVWGEDTIQAQLQECTRNQKIFEKISRKLTEAGYDRTFQQCRDKIKKLKGDYKKVKDKHGKTGEDRSNWEYFDAMDAILGSRPATKPPVVLDTSSTPVTIDNPEEQLDQDEPEKDNDNESLSTSSSTASLVPTSSTASNVSGSTPLTSRKRKRSAKSDNAVIEMIESVVKAQSRSDKKMLELEEKRLQMEERQLEREVQQRREDREFQLQMMRFMVCILRLVYQTNIDQSSSMDRPSSPSPFPMGSLYNAYSRPFEDDQ